MNIIKPNTSSMRYSATSLGVAALLAGASLLIALPAAAQVGVNASVNASAAIPARVMKADIQASTTMMMDRGGKRSATTTEQRMQYVQGKGDSAIVTRIDSLTKLLTRIQGMRKLPSSQQASLSASIQAEITSLTSLQARVNGDTSTTSLKDDVGSITKSYRIYMLVEPQAQIAAASDRALNIVSMIGTVVSKIQTRISSDASLSSNTTIQVALAGIASSTADATVQANAAITETSSLQPDNGNTTVAASNTVALKDARAKLKLVQTDLQAAQKDIQAIIKLIVSGDKSLGASASTTVSQ